MEVALLKQDILCHQEMYLKKDLRRVFVERQVDVLTEDKSKAATPEPRAVAAGVLWTERAGSKGKPGQIQTSISFLLAHPPQATPGYCCKLG